MHFQFNSWDETYKKPFGAVKTNTSVVFNVKSDADEVYINGFDKKYHMEKDGENFTVAITPHIEYGLIFYTFEAVKDGHTKYYGKGEKCADAVENGSAYQLTIHNNNNSPEWFRGKVMYQIYTDRFYKGGNSETAVRSNILMHTSWNEKPVYIKDEQGRIVLWDFFGGNLDGVIQKLDYLRELGVDIIYLNPIFESSSNHKYDTADYTKVDIMYGNDDTLKRLIDEANKKDMKIMLDGVFSHTGDDSVYFNRYGNYGDGGAYRDESSIYRSWYDFKSYPDDYDCWWGVTSLPCTKEMEPTFLDHLLNENTGAVIKWMKMGIAGWRLDVADELPDEFMVKLKQAILKVNPDAVLLGEVWEDASNKVSYDARRNYIVNNSLNSVSNYPLRDGLIALLDNRMSAEDFAYNYMTMQENYPRDIFLSLMNMTGTHDSSRLFTLLGGAPDKDSMNTWEQRRYELSDDMKHIAYKKLMIYYLMLYSLPGNPCIYYGDEICLEGYKDPYNRGTFDWDKNSEGIADLIRKLKVLRDNLNVKDAKVNVRAENNMLKWSVTTSDSSFEVFVNTCDNPVSIETHGRETKYMINAYKENTQLIINELGAVVL